APRSSPTALIVSRVPTFSGKGFASPVPREHVLPILALIVVILWLLVSHPFETVSLLTLVYVAAIPVSVQRYLRRKAQDAAGSKDKAPAPGN
ncbi:MAG TPA: CDP-diacylglycerol--serine O-phosphatidyltransferase, partial [Rhabdaerophilum sp.]|nr:CDP-diacylglycerol--serine O-phosphatidyltransferase [Rhabdaerophilum sp.]